MNKIIVIAGPTASGKTSLGITLAKKFNGEIICADSRSIYKNLNIGTAKPYIDKPYKLIRNDKKFGPVYEIDGVIHYCLDIADINSYYSVAEFQQLANSLIKDIISRGKTPFLVGGTGLYINSVIYGYQFPKENLKKRENIEALSDEEIIEKLKQYDSATLEKYKNNRRRLVRALEVYELEKRPISKAKRKQPDFEYIMLAIDWPREELYQRIDKWVDMRLKMGLIQEVEGILKQGINHERLQDFGLEYRHIDNYLQNPTKSNYNIQVTNLKYKIHAFARRQYTWFRRNKEIIWLSARKDLNKKSEKIITDFLK